MTFIAPVKRARQMVMEAAASALPVDQDRPGSRIRRSHGALSSAINQQAVTIDRGGCAAARSEHSVAATFRMTFLSPRSKDVMGIAGLIGGMCLPAPG
jgi:hypothetical protein